MVQIDASASITLDPGISKAKPLVEVATFNNRKVAVAHLIEGINLGTAATTGSPIVEPVIKMTGKFDIVGDSGDDVSLPGFQFGFIQVGSVIVLEDTYLGRTQNDGHVKLRHKQKVSPTVLLDTIASFKPFSSRAPAFGSDTKGGKKISRLTIDLGIFPNKKGDSPHGFSGAIVTNRETHADNFLFEYRADVGFATVLAASIRSRRCRRSRTSPGT